MGLTRTDFALFGNLADIVAADLRPDTRAETLAGDRYAIMDTDLGQGVPLDNGLFANPISQESGEIIAEDVSYDNTQSGLEADNVQDAIDENFVATVSNAQDIENLKGLNPTTPETDDYPMQLGDADAGEIWMNRANDCNVYVPTDAQVDFKLETKILVIWEGPGKVNIVPDSGVTINDQSGVVSITERYQGVTLTKRGPNTWIGTGAGEFGK